MFPIVSVPSDLSCDVNDLVRVSSMTMSANEIHEYKQVIINFRFRYVLAVLRRGSIEYMFNVLEL